MDTQFTPTERKQVAQLVIDRLRMEPILPSGANMQKLEHLKDAILTLQVFGGDDWELAIGLVGEAVRNMNVWVTYGVETKVLPTDQAQNLVKARDEHRAILMKMIGEKP